MVLVGRVALLGTVVAPLVGAIVVLTGGPTSGRGQRAAAALAWISAVLALMAAGVVGLHGPFAVGWSHGHARLVLGLWANQLTVTLVTLVCVVGASVQSFSLRYLHGDRSAGRFLAAAHAVVAAMVIVCSAATLAMLVLGWIAAGAAFVVVLGCRPDLPGVRSATRRTARMFVLGDLGLVAAFVVVWHRVGDVDLASAGSLRSAAAHLGGLTTPVALLVALSVLTRSAQGPLGRWLPGTVAAPTPTSALLHAGVVNGGGILLVRLGALASGSLIDMAGIFVVAGVTAVVAKLAMAQKADVKGGLVFSTMSQMGFMVAECAVGAYLAALMHLIGHALYKATMFFGSGSQVPRPGEAPIAPSVVTSRTLRVLAATVAAGITAAVMAALPGALDHRGAVVLIVFAASTAAAASWSWWERPPASARGMLLWAEALVAAGTLYGLVLDTLGGWIAPSLPAVGAGVLSPWWLLVVASAGVAGAALAQLPSLRRRVAAIMLDAATPRPRDVARPLPGDGRTRPAAASAHPPTLGRLWRESAA